MRTRTALILTICVLATALAAGQKIETVDGVKLVHNSGPGAWGKTAKVALEPVRTLGDVDTADENLAFYMPSAVAVDGAGNIYILDTGNHRVQKFGPDGKYLATLGRQGQGPGEFYFPAWLDVDAQGFLYVSDPNNQRIQVLTPDGKDHKTIKGLAQGAGTVFLGKPGELVTGAPRMRFMMNEEEKKPAALPKLVKVLDFEGKPVREFGDPVDFKNELVNNAANEAILTVDGAGQTYLVFPAQNRIEKYAADGRLLWRADRELPYSMEIKDKGEIKRDGGQRLHPGAPAEPLRGRRRRRRAGPDLGGHPDPPDQKGGAGRAGGHRDDERGRRADDRLQAPGRRIGAADDRRLQARGLRRRRRPARIAAARLLRRRHLHPRRPALPDGQVPRHAIQGIPHKGIGPHLQR